MAVVVGSMGVRESCRDGGVVARREADASPIGSAAGA